MDYMKAQPRLSLDRKLELLRDNLSINGVKRYYLYKTWKMPKQLLISLQRAKKQVWADLLVEYTLSYDLVGERFLSNVSLHTLIPRVRALANKHNTEALWNYYDKLRKLPYRKPPIKKNKVEPTVEELRAKLDYPCSFVDCVNERHPDGKGLRDTYCDECIANRFTKSGSPKILTHWKRKIEKTASDLAMIIYPSMKAGGLIESFDKIKFVVDTRRFAHRRYGKYAHYSNTRNEIRMFIRKFNTETEILMTYAHEVAHHYCPKTVHGKPFVRFLRALSQELGFKPTSYHSKRDGSINWTYVMDIELNSGY